MEAAAAEGQAVLRPPEGSCGRRCLCLLGLRVELPRSGSAAAASSIVNPPKVRARLGDSVVTEREYWAMEDSLQSPSF
uniref:Uncharacterized protein n=1 Tax=Sphaerodactylus townsendi TaxID=933632 RepID=A0ACB8EGN1_9SAUR